jgi:hypothetical protein
MTDTFRKEYKTLSEDQKNDIEKIKNIAERLLTQFYLSGVNYSVDQRMMALAKTNLEQAIMWAVKAIT